MITYKSNEKQFWTYQELLFSLPTLPPFDICSAMFLTIPLFLIELCGGGAVLLIFFPSLDALFVRFEPPDSRNRWDAPLFTIQVDDKLPCEDIYNALYQRKAPPPNQSTQSVSRSYRQLYIHCVYIFVYCLYLDIPNSQNRVLFPLSKQIWLWTQCIVFSLIKLRKSFCVHV